MKKGKTNQKETNQKKINRTGMFKSKAGKAGMLAGICAAVCVAVTAVFYGSRLEEIPDEDLPLGNRTELVKEGKYDRMVIPDKYNTGCKESGLLQTVNDSQSYGGLNFKLGSGGTALTVDFLYGNNNVTGRVVIRNTDFSQKDMAFNRSGELASNAEIVFENCKFGAVRTEEAPGKVTFRFKDCTLASFGGSNADFENCRFGGTIYDGLNPLRNVTLQDCYIADLAHVGYRVLHADGTHIYGREGMDAGNITYKNCRIEVPNLIRSGSNSGCYVNSCISVGMEYSDGHDMLFEDCIINGGGYSIYATTKSGHTISNITFKNILVGNACQYGSLYYNNNPGVVYENVSNTDSLYVASVWKGSDGRIHLSVTNDTKKDRTLIAVTEKGRETFTIPACAKASAVPADTPFEDMPFDIDIAVPGNQWVVCYDGIESEGQQIRYVNWSGESVYREVPDQEQVLAFQTPEAVEEGSCGAGLTYVLDEKGVLTISGTGAMTNYTSGNAAPWRRENADEIRKVIIEEGVTSIGSQAFYKCSQITEVILPDTLEKIEGNAFLGCGLLREIFLPEALSKIGDRAFNATNIKTAYYAGTERDFGRISIGNFNDRLVNADIRYGDGTEEGGAEEAETVLEGSCGKNLNFVLDSEGVLTISGKGEMTDYTSGRPAPWKAEHSNDIRSVVLEEGVTGIGTQAFYKCTKLEEVVFPDTLISIRGNAFLGCTSLKEIRLPKSVTLIGNRAFNATGITNVYYEGTEEEFQRISIGSFNEKVTGGSTEYNQDKNK